MPYTLFQRCFVDHPFLKGHFARSKCVSLFQGSFVYPFSKVFCRNCMSLSQRYLSRSKCVSLFQWYFFYLVFFCPLLVIPLSQGFILISSKKYCAEIVMYFAALSAPPQVRLLLSPDGVDSSASLVCCLQQICAIIKHRHGSQP